ncbi:hypothetical protein BDW75DRAFT_250169 [Aspergillus navahoensis]
MSHCICTDVFVVGGGPVGLTVAYSLTRQGVTSLLVGQHDKNQQAMYGRATTLYPRTLEMLDQLDLLDDLNQIGYVARNSVTFKDGKRVTSRGWQKMFEAMHGTYLDYCLNIRQKYSEELESFSVDHESKNDYKVTSQVRNVKTDEVLVVKSYELISLAVNTSGHSLVRRLANIPFEGEPHRWVRIDGCSKTNMPDADLGFASIESRQYGNVLWVQLDHGVKRIGFAMTEDMLTKYGERFTEEDAKQEAITSMEPFTLEFESIDWWTLYSINQRVADAYISNDRVILAGDACHTHSSGAAQGMNTGVHDAVNLAWNLVLDKAFSAVISGQIPDSYQGRYTDANELFTKLFDETIQFSIGLGIHYGESMINWPSTTGMISAGWRAPDALVLTKNLGQWSIVIFAGQPSETQGNLATAVETLGALVTSLPRGMIRFVTVVAQNVAQGNRFFSIPRLGYLCSDQDQSAHAAYTISPGRGAVVVLRPDGILAHATALEDVRSAVSFLSGLTGVAPRFDYYSLS